MVSLDSFKRIGIDVRTTNQAEVSGQGKIGELPSLRQGAVRSEKSFTKLGSASGNGRRLRPNGSERILAILSCMTSAAPIRRTP